MSRSTKEETKTDRDVNIIRFVLKKNGLTEPLQIQRFSSGSINRVYDLGNRLVLKIESKGEHDILKPTLEMTARLTAKGAKVPRILDFGTVEGNRYILMRKVSGGNLASSWMSFPDRLKEGFVNQLAEQLQIWHSISFDRYSMPVVSYTSFENLRPAVERLTSKQTRLIQKDKLPKKLAKDIDELEKFYHDNIAILDETGTAVMVHQDIHLENVFYQGKRLTGIIDLDWVCQAPKDYELWKILDTFHRPKFTVEVKIEHLYGDYQMTKELSWLKKYYPALFQVPSLATRIRLYYLDPLLETLIDYQRGLWCGRGLPKTLDKVHDFYQSPWLEDVLAV